MYITDNKSATKVYLEAMHGSFISKRINEHSDNRRRNRRKRRRNK